MGVSHLHHRSARQTARLRQIVVVSVLCLAIYCFLLVPDESLDSSRSTNPEAYQTQTQPPARQRESAGRLSPDLLSNRFLPEDQCRASFPGLLDQVDGEVAKGAFKLEPYPSNLGPLFARIRDGQTPTALDPVGGAQGGPKQRHARAPVRDTTPDRQRAPNLAAPGVRAALVAVLAHPRHHLRLQPPRRPARVDALVLAARGPRAAASTPGRCRSSGRCRAPRAR
ncbi:hypothetical protein GQX73_g8244 [Xylaria multiplex]|uniref:Uncharacterized protein n=1 Tax=Xylaria multiplex TaxID=323545 RepID=A0A7C8N0I3_9PEZI|nr:hypothetical protein GQX73_g8244 [Xylaria multiplex]